MSSVASLVLLKNPPLSPIYFLIASLRGVIHVLDSENFRFLSLRGLKARGNLIEDLPNRESYYEIFLQFKA